MAVAYRRQWLRPSKLRAYVVDYAPSIRSVEDAEYQLYWAVIEGKVRVRYKGKSLDADMLERLRTKKWSDEPNDLYGLPVDIELSVEDAEGIWGADDVGLDPADRITFYGMSGAAVVLSAETAILSIKIQIQRLEARLRAADGSAQKLKPEFEERWAKHHHEAKTYLAHMVDAEKREELSAQLALLEEWREATLSGLETADSPIKTTDLARTPSSAPEHDAGDEGQRQAHKKGKGGTKPGPYRRRLRKHLEFRDQNEPGGLENVPIGQLAKDARRRLINDGVQGVPKSRSGMEDAVKTEIRKMRAREPLAGNPPVIPPITRR